VREPPEGALPVEGAPEDADEGGGEAERDGGDGGEEK
jgi:hypothetical protein